MQKVQLGAELVLHLAGAVGLQNPLGFCTQPLHPTKLQTLVQKPILHLTKQAMIFPRLPGPPELGPLLQKLEGHPGSVVLVAIDQEGTCNFARCTWAWLSREERIVLKGSLERARREREKASPAVTTPETNQKPENRPQRAKAPHV